MSDIKEIIKLLETSDTYEASSRLIDLVGKKTFIDAVNGNPKAMLELGHKLIEEAKNIQEGPKTIKDKTFLKNLNKLRDR